MKTFYTLIFAAVLIGIIVLMGRKNVPVNQIEDRPSIGNYVLKTDEMTHSNESNTTSAQSTQSIKPNTASENQNIEGGIPELITMPEAKQDDRSSSLQKVNDILSNNSQNEAATLDVSSPKNSGTIFAPDLSERSKTLERIRKILEN